MDRNHPALFKIKLSPILISPLLLSLYFNNSSPKFEQEGLPMHNILNSIKNNFLLFRYLIVSGN